MTSPLTDAQADAIALDLAQTNQNIFQVTAALLGRKLNLEENDPVYEHVCRVGQIFKCEECNNWKALSEKSGVLEDFCVECEEESIE